MYTKSERFHCFSGTCLLNAQVTAFFPVQSRGWGSNMRPESFSGAVGHHFQKLPQDWKQSAVPAYSASLTSRSLSAPTYTLTHKRYPVVRSDSNYSMLSFKWKFQFSPLPFKWIVGARRSKFLVNLSLNTILWQNSNRRLLLRQKYLIGSFVNCTFIISAQTFPTKKRKSWI